MIDDMSNNNKKRKSYQSQYTAVTHGGASFYFDEKGKSKASKKGKGDKNKFSTLQDLPNIKQVRKIMETIKPKHKAELNALNLKYESQFENWHTHLMNGFNLLLFGYGSKKHILDKFINTIESLSKSEYLINKSIADSQNKSLSYSPPCILTIQGYSSASNIKSIISQILLNYLQIQESQVHGTVNSQCEFIVSKCNAATAAASLASNQKADKTIVSTRRRLPPYHTRDLFICIHNIDGATLRNSAVQTCLSILSKCSKIKLIATIDHVHSLAMWDQRQIELFNWLKFDVTTYATYKFETEDEIPITGDQNLVAQRGAAYVFQSLTPRHMEVLQILAKHQMSSNDSLGMEYMELFDEALDQMLVMSENDLKTLLREFLDHQVIERKVAASNQKTYVRCILDDSVIRKEILNKDF